MAQYRVQLAFVLFLLVLAVGGFFYERHVDASGNKRAFDSCLRQNTHRKANNTQTLILKTIMKDVARRNRVREGAAKKRGDLKAAEEFATVATQWEGYDKSLFRVPIAPCYDIYGYRREK